MRMKSRGLACIVLSVPLLFVACVSAPESAPVAEVQPVLEATPIVESLPLGTAHDGKPESVMPPSPPAEPTLASRDPLPESPFAEDGPPPPTPVPSLALIEIPLPTPQAAPVDLVRETMPASVLAPVTEASPAAAVTVSPKPVAPKPAPPPKATPPKAASATSAGAVPSSGSAATPKPAPTSALPAETPTPIFEREVVPVPAAGLPSLPAREAPAIAPEAVAVSRSVRAMVGQLIEVPYRGNGWVFLGEQGARRGLVYDSRRLDEAGQSFIFRAELPGTYTVKFYRQDYVNDLVINDYVAVRVDAAAAAASIGGFSVPVDRGRVIAEPRWPPAEISAAKAADAVITADAAKVADTATASSGAAARAPVVGMTAESTVVAVSSPNNPSDASAMAAPDESLATFLARARKELADGRIDAAIAILDASRVKHPILSDEALLLYGRSYEANGPTKNVKSAIDFYRTLTREYPQSPHYDEAARRAAYLQRFYVDIR